MTTLESLLWQLYDGDTGVLSVLSDWLEDSGDERSVAVRSVDLTPKPWRVLFWFKGDRSSVAGCDSDSAMMAYLEVAGEAFGLALDRIDGRILRPTPQRFSDAAALDDAHRRAARDVLRLFPEVQLFARPDSLPLPERMLRLLTPDDLAERLSRDLLPLWPETEPVRNERLEAVTMAWNLGVNLSQAEVAASVGLAPPWDQPQEWPETEPVYGTNDLHAAYGAWRTGQDMLEATANRFVLALPLYGHVAEDHTPDLPEGASPFLTQPAE